MKIKYKYVFIFFNHFNDKTIVPVIKVAADRRQEFQ